MQNKLLVIILISLFSFAYTATGQKLINSPYSRFKIGKFFLGSGIQIGKNFSIGANMILLSLTSLL